MSEEATLYYLYQPLQMQPVSMPIEFVTVQSFLNDEPACRMLWEMVASQFRTRSKFLMIWQHVRHVCVHRNVANEVDGLLLISSPINWQIDYVVVHPQARGQGIAIALVKHALNEALKAGVPYVMLTSRAGLRVLYESECGLRVVASKP